MTDDAFEIAAAISALGFLVQVQYADRFAGRPDAAARVIDELIRLTRVAATTSEPMLSDEQHEAKLEIQVRVTTYLERFGNSIVQRIQSGRAV